MVDSDPETPEIPELPAISAAPMITESVFVSLGERSYDIAIGTGLLAAAGALMKPVLGSNRVVVITDATVAPLHLDHLVAGLQASDLQVDKIIIPAGEASKSLDQFGALMDQLLALRLTRRDTLIALGGGVVGDLVGFAASSLMRGVPFIQVPTTLLSQVDSSVGGKTGINTKYGKNLIGAFYQPRYVMIDLGVLKSLPQRELLAGYAEIVKYGLINSPDFFGWLEEQGQTMLKGCEKRLAHAIANSCRSKARIVSADEREQGKRALLNLGHTFGHALEAEMGYDGRLLHGEAVAIGMVLAFDLSVRMGLCRPEALDRVIRHFDAVGLPKSIDQRLKGWLTEDLISHMFHDKKVDQGQMNFILVRDIGKAEVMAVTDMDLLHDVLSA